MNTNSVIKQNDSLGRLIVGLLLLIYLSVSVGVLRSRLLMTFTALETDVIGIEPNQVNQAIIMLLAGALGSLVYEIRAYYIHACEKKDFNRAHIPWYVLWFFQGALLGLIFYFVVRGGLLLITISGNDQSQADLNTWSLAAIGSLVGLLDLDEMERKSEKRILEETLKLDEEYKIKIHGSDLQTELFQKQQKERQAEIDLKKKDDELQEINP
jgi:hypothetical protein